MAKKKDKPTDYTNEGIPPMTDLQIDQQIEIETLKIEVYESDIENTPLDEESPKIQLARLYLKQLEWYKQHRVGIPF